MALAKERAKKEGVDAYFRLTVVEHSQKLNIDEIKKTFNAIFEIATAYSGFWSCPGKNYSPSAFVRNALINPLPSFDPDQDDNDQTTQFVRKGF